MTGGEKFVNIGEIDVLELTQVDDTVKNLIRRGKLWVFNKIFGDQWWADLFGQIVEGDYSKACPTSPKMITSVIRDYAYRMVDLSAVIGEEVAEEFIGEMLSEGMSSALETNFVGGLQYILNVWKGSLPPDLSVAFYIGQRLDRVSRLYALSQIAPIGHSPQAILESLVGGADIRLREKLSTAKQLYLEYLTAKNTGITEHVTQFTNFIADAISELVFGAVAFIDKLDGVINSVAQEHLARLNQLEDNLEANELRYINDIIDDDTYNLRLTEIDVDVTATIDTYDVWIEEIDGMIDEYANWLNTYVMDIANTIKSLISAYEGVVNSVINKIVDVINNIDDDVTLKNMVLELYNDLRAYRKAGFNYK